MLTNRFLTSLVLILLSMTTSAFGSVTYRPANLNPESAGLIVVIHGCLQEPESMALGTGWASIAEKNNLIVLYPKVKPGTNDLGCWSWYLAENQSSKSGELKDIKSEIELTIKQAQLKNPKIYLAGLSSGGATVAGLLACYPNYFTAAGIHSGTSYGLAKNQKDARKVLKEGPPKEKLKSECDSSKNSAPIIVIHGKEDNVVNSSHATKIIEDFLETKEPKSKNKKSENDLNYEISNYENKSIKGQLVLVDGLGHAWAGFGANSTWPLLTGPKGKFPTSLPFFTDKGPNSTQIMWDFFQAQLKN